ncbi:MAG: hypothetical protein SXV54_09310 [Chloroflexota bacterium]|nr:hypothetical protein [Chloroflexota bacterium]
MADDKLKILANLIRIRKKDNPYIVLLGSGLSLTSAVIQAVIGRDDWDTFCGVMHGLSPEERYSLLKAPLDGLDLTRGYCCLAKLVKAGHFNPILTANFDSYLLDALVAAGLTSEDLEVLVNGKDKVQQIIAALKRSSPPIKVLMLRGRLQARIVPVTPEEIFEFDSQIADVLEEHLARDVIVIGSNPRDSDINRCIRARGGSIWYITPEPPSTDDYTYLAQRARGTGGVITGEYADFNRFFCALVRDLNLEVVETPGEVQEIDSSRLPNRGLDDRETVIQEEIEHQENVLAEHTRNRRALEKIVAAQGFANVDIVLKLERVKDQERETKERLNELRELSSLDVPDQQ